MERRATTQIKQCMRLSLSTELLYQWKHLMQLDIEPSSNHLILCLRWTRPKSLWTKTEAKFVRSIRVSTRSWTRVWFWCRTKIRLKTLVRVFDRLGTVLKWTLLALKRLVL